jgi:primase-polymerase (primpol)-like protein
MIMDTTYLPAELRTREQWVVWGYRMRDGQQTKVPYDANTTQPPVVAASTTEPRTGASFECARTAAVAAHHPSPCPGHYDIITHCVIV